MSTSLTVGIAGIGLLGPGLTDWAQAAPLLREPQLWQSAATVIPTPTLLPATERRRAGPAVKASVWVAESACRAAGVAPDSVATVFSSSTGEPSICHALCEALATAERLVSPTRFTNSVHNVAAGYWHIGCHSMTASTSLGAHDGSLAAGLLEAAAQCVLGGKPLLLVACDVPYPEPLHGVRPLPDSFALALLLVPGGGRRLQVGLAGDQAPTACAHAGLEALRRQLPTARALPLLQVLAGEQAAALVLDGEPGMALSVHVDAA